MTTATEVGRDFSLYMRTFSNDPGKKCSTPQATRLITELLDARATTPEDALVLVSWLNSFLEATVQQMPEDEPDGQAPKYLATISLGLAHQALKALEATTGISAAVAYGGDVKACN